MRGYLWNYLEYWITANFLQKWKFPLNSALEVAAVSFRVKLGFRTVLIVKPLRPSVTNTIQSFSRGRQSSRASHRKVASWFPLVPQWNGAALDTNSNVKQKVLNLNFDIFHLILYFLPSPIISAPYGINMNAKGRKRKYQRLLPFFGCALVNERIYSIRTLAETVKIPLSMLCREARNKHNYVIIGAPTLWHRRKRVALWCLSTSMSIAVA